MKMGWRRVALLLFLSVPALQAGAQDISEEDITSSKGYTRFVGIGFGAAYQYYLDEAIAPLIYSRIGGAASVCNTKTNEVKYTELSFQGSYLKTDRKRDELVDHKIKSLKAVMDYRHLYKITVLNPSVYDVRVGGIFSTQFNYKNAPHLNNSGNIYDYAISLGVCGKIARQNYFGDRLGHMVLDIGIPFVSNVCRPPYLNRTSALITEAKPVSEFFANNSMTSFGKFFRFNARIHLLYPLKTTNKLRFTYQWDYYKMEGASTVYMAEHSFIINFMLNY